jgi:glycosyltransferase involved in cell wall biosynthesis
MNQVRWFKISEALARAGFRVDVICATSSKTTSNNDCLRFVPRHLFRWQDYDVIKTCFHKGFQFLREIGGLEHPFIISKLGSVVGKSDSQPGVHFFGDTRRELYEIQQAIARISRFVAVLTEPSRALWKSNFNSDNLLLVPTGADREIPPPRSNPYAGFPEKIAVYIGNLYSGVHQPEVNRHWQRRLNSLGRALKQRGVRLCFVGSGLVDEIDIDAVTLMGPVPNDKIFDYQYHADVGIVLAQGPIQHNESSKIYYYLRTGLPVVSEAPVPNNQLIRDVQLGSIVPYGDDETMAERIAEVSPSEIDRRHAIDFVLENHTWDHRASIYARIIASHGGKV